MIVITYTARSIDLHLPAPADIAAVDIAHALSTQACYGGRSKAFYSRAERAVRLHHEVLTPNYRIYALLHDAEMAYAPDAGFPDAASAARMHACILQAFGLPELDLSGRVTLKAGMARLAINEARDLFGLRSGSTTPEFETVDERMPPFQAEMRYLRLLDSALSSRSAADQTFRAKYSSQHVLNAK